MGYGLHVIGGHVVGMSISNSLVIPMSVGDVDTIKPNFSFNNGESWILAS